MKSSAKKNTAQKEAHSYASVSKLVEEKNIVIAEQAKQITNLRTNLEKVRTELESNRQKMVVF